MIRHYLGLPCHGKIFDVYNSICTMYIQFRPEGSCLHTTHTDSTQLLTTFVLAAAVCIDDSQIVRVIKLISMYSFVNL